MKRRYGVFGAVSPADRPRRAFRFDRKTKPCRYGPGRRRDLNLCVQCSRAASSSTDWPARNRFGQPADGPATSTEKDRGTNLGRKSGPFCSLWECRSIPHRHRNPAASADPAARGGFGIGHRRQPFGQIERLHQGHEITQPFSQHSTPSSDMPVHLKLGKPVLDRLPSACKKRGAHR